jgi:microcystin degradation protein MlrC
VELTDILVAYRTNPHRDQAKTGARAARVLVQTVTGDVTPRIHWRTLPMLMGGGTTVDLLPTMGRCFKKLQAFDKLDGVLDASLFMCHPYNSDPALGWTSVVMTDDRADVGERLADELADALWATRDVPAPSFPPPEEAIARARKHKLLRKVGVITISDVSDVVTTGTTGENPALVKALLEHGEGMVCYAGIHDPAVVRELFELAPGARVDIPVGGKLSPELYEPLPVSGTLRSKHELDGYGKTVVLDLGHVQLVVVEGPALMLQPRFYKQVGLPILRADIVMVKNFFPYLLYFAPYHRWTYFAKTRGLSDFDVAYSMERDGPMHPTEKLSDWRECDRRRRLAEPATTEGDQQAA